MAMWGCRLAVPLKGDDWTVTVDDVRALVANIHKRIEVDEPPDELFLHVLGTGKLQKRRLPRCMSHLREVPLVILGAYKLRSPHFTALSDIQRDEPGI